MYSSYDIVDETGTSEVKSHSENSMLWDCTCTIYVKNARRHKKEGNADAQPSMESRAKAETKTKEAVEKAVKTDFGLQAKTLGLLGHITRRVEGNEGTIPESDLQGLLSEVPRLKELGNKYDLRLLDSPKDPRPQISEWPVAYLLFERNNFTKGTKVTAKMVAEFAPVWVSGLRESFDADKTVRTDTSSFWSSPVLHLGKNSFETCDAIGWAVCCAIADNDRRQDVCQGVSCLTDPYPVICNLIEVGSPLHKWIMAAPYRTNLFADGTH